MAVDATVSLGGVMVTSAVAADTNAGAGAFPGIVSVVDVVTAAIAASTAFVADTVTGVSTVGRDVWPGDLEGATSATGRAALLPSETTREPVGETATFEEVGAVDAGSDGFSVAARARFPGVFILAALFTLG